MVMAAHRSGVLRGLGRSYVGACTGTVTNLLTQTELFCCRPLSLLWTEKSRQCTTGNRKWRCSTVLYALLCLAIISQNFQTLLSFFVYLADSVFVCVSVWLSIRLIDGRILYRCLCVYLSTSSYLSVCLSVIHFLTSIGGDMSIITTKPLCCPVLILHHPICTILDAVCPWPKTFLLTQLKWYNTMVTIRRNLIYATPKGSTKF